ncbi:hypothetical protein [Halogranum rubrum]|uniref:Uncharacterized protein n=1 Tax=Halogranum salarium B-1 TaxID=1210908 RepID=J3ESW4_9EURY|nr:hypothetical protein [Halogranum salarium]EJN57097.1 hypothetical protein HSB1_44830 [Halogranum salarium B-1]
MENRTIGDNLAEATTNLENAIQNEGYGELSARQQAYLQEALYYLEVVQEGSEPTHQSTTGVTTVSEGQ